MWTRKSKGRRKNKTLKKRRFMKCESTEAKIEVSSCGIFYPK